MKNAWKWILGILVLVIVVAVVVAVPLVLRRNMMATAVTAGQSQLPGVNNIPGQPQNFGQQRQFPGGRFPQQRGPGMNGFQGRRGMMGDFGGFNRGFSPFGMGFMFFGGLMRLIPLVLLAVVVFAAYQFGKRAGMRANMAAPATVPVHPAPTQAPEVTAAAQENNDSPVI